MEMEFHVFQVGLELSTAENDFELLIRLIPKCWH